MHSIHAILVAVFVALPATGFAQQPEQNPQTTPADNSITARILSTQVVKKRTDGRSSTDLVTFNGQLFLTFLERWIEGSSESCIRIISSKDGSKWSTVATIRQQEKERYLVSRHLGNFRSLRLDDTPRFSIESENRLSIRAVDAKFSTPEFDSRRMAGWSSNNGTDWSYEGPLNEVLQWSEIAWNGGKGYAYEYGGPCGESLAMKVLATEDGKGMREIYKYFDFNGSSPNRAALFFDDSNRLCCLAPMYGGGRKNKVKGVKKGYYALAYLGTAEPPYRKWTWKKTNMAIWSPRVVSVPEKGIVAVAEIRSEPIRTSLCSLNLHTGKLTELLSFADLRSQQLGIDDHEPGGAEDLPIGLAHHNGHVWVSYNRGGAVHVAKIALDWRDDNSKTVSKPRSNEARIEFRLVSNGKPVEGVTEKKGFQTGYSGQRSMVYPYQEPFFTITREKIEELTVPPSQYLGSIKLTKKAKVEMLAALRTPDAKSSGKFMMFLFADGKRVNHSVHFVGAYATGRVEISIPTNDLESVFGISTRKMSSAPAAPEKTVEAAAEVIELKQHAAPVHAIQWSADGKRLATVCEDGMVCIWDAAGKLLSKTQVEPVKFPVVSITPDLRRIAVVRGRDVLGSRPIERNGGQAMVYSLPDGKMLSRFNARTEPIRDYPFTAYIFAVDLSPDGTRLAVGGSVEAVGGRHGLPGGIATVWDTEKAQIIRRSTSFVTSVVSLTWTTDGEVLMIGTCGSSTELAEAGKIHAWHKSRWLPVNGSLPSRKIFHSSFLRPLPVGKPGYADAVGVRDLRVVDNHLTALIVDAEKEIVRKYDLMTGESKSTGTTEINWRSKMKLALSSQGTFVAAHKEDSAHIYDSSTMKRITTVKLPSAVRSVGFDPQDTKVAIGTDAGTVQIHAVTK